MSAPVEKTADAAVADVTNTLANTTISEKSAEAKPANDAGHQSANEGRRLYIGNLAYATQEDQLKEFFNGYLVESVSIPKNPRTDRPVGYAFVDLSTPSEADRAINDLSGKEILERKVSVQLARKPEPAGERGEGANGDSAEGSRRRTSGRGRARGRGRGGRLGRGGRVSESGNHDGTGAEAAKDVSAEGQPLGDITNQTPSDKGAKGAKQSARPRERRERGPPADGIPSKTKVMVANLPYDLSEEKLKELFTTYEPSSAKIALRPIPRFMIKKLQARGEARKGRGFGFVTLASEEMQQKAVTEMDGKEIEGREIAVKVAIDSPDKTDEEALHHQADHEEAAEAGANGTEEASAPVTTEAAAVVPDVTVPAATTA
ncbi:hypothetical protein MKZ38_000155 [Zalerion maritima]|uniref:RRM domain-containing protein n=1 Tax=Zalerion maritima TaxID=339359 RepID=A0AAD5RT52_9PEZI|nr:hypothetical protein MKZ38_000155 [Zalerion maritima]